MKSVEGLARFKLAAGVSLLAVAIGATLLVTATLDSTYFDQSSSFALGGVADEGDRVYVGLAQVDARGDDHVRLLALDGVTRSVGSQALRLRASDGAISVIPERLMLEKDVAASRELAGLEFTNADGPFQVVAVVRMGSDDVEIAPPTLWFSVNGGQPQHEKLRVAARICSNARHGDVPCDGPEPPR